ncbi:alpha/beta-hydrolase [Piedraia hortae CBS 480.64]|uniref:Alpha/beta-hydrolase n=1 Tax=Piedraia hortae CBS 480.64 TaxID=1314780 RepID=A0A6A7BYH4_9PEZI|nr:alpha/beta-hydrolase [Piedraia hortae CBS 480.64]
MACCLRLRLRLGLWLSIFFILLELVVRSIILVLPEPVINLFYRLSRRAFHALSPRCSASPSSNPMASAQDFIDLCAIFDCPAEEHIVQTKDGYLLGLHRLGSNRTSDRPVVYLHHGLLMNSEVWMCATTRERCLPIQLHEAGYDVWLGNNRGNKYSKKSLYSVPTEAKFWDFSIDQFAFHDIPDSIDYILSTTGAASLSYIGFSQGSAQAFAALSIHPELNKKVNVFVALAPAMAPPGLSSGVVASLCQSNPEVLYLAFRRKSILGSAPMWSALLDPGIFAYFIDKSLLHLFDWHMHNISQEQKLAAYPHLYSFTSTKCVVHWFQIIRNGTFQMFDDEFTATPWPWLHTAKYYKVPKFPTKNISTPIVLVYGGRDSLVNIDIMKRELPSHTLVRRVDDYEHLDFLWADSLHLKVFPFVREALHRFARLHRERLAIESCDARVDFDHIDSYHVGPQEAVS